jgi:hypothetical protein
LVESTAQDVQTTDEIENTTPPSSKPLPTPTKRVWPDTTAEGNGETVIPTQKPTSKPLPANDWQYPLSTEISQNPLTMKSQDSPDTIFDWYLVKIESLNLSATTKIRTKSNDTYRYVLAAAGDSIQLKVEINRDAGESNTTMTVTITEGYL